MKKKLPYLLPSFVFFLGAPLIWLLCFREVPLRVSPETTHITQPLTKDGKSIDWFRAIRERFEPQCKPEDNGFRMIAAALGRSPYFDEPDWYWPEFCKALDLDPNLTPTLKFERPVEYINREYLIWLDENEDAESIDDTVKLRERLFNEAWTTEEFPFMARWIEENSPFLDLLAEAVRKEYFFIPGLEEPENSLDQTAFYRFWKMISFDSMTAFQCRMQFRLGNGDVDGAWRDAMSSSVMFLQAQRFQGNATFYRGPYFFQDQLKIVRDRSLTSEQRKCFLADLDTLPPFEERSDVLLRDRLRGLWAIDLMSKSPGNTVVGEENLRYINWNLVAARVNRYFDLLEQAADPSKRDELLEDLENRPKRSRLSNLIGKPITTDERSAELAWRMVQGLQRLADLIFSGRREQALDELHRRLENETHRRAGDEDRTRP